ncbi:phosphatase PAP2 family protein [Leptospira borgpetersenii]|uniref:Membrane associated acid phosphatase n=2 Tax=Leptospira borgpetersenii serovar Hardjo-bovis TaxID=338217 RepID=Q04RA9_LEPBJ|nr:phosphatase PAP2 family protein [Leptospira borgpetersenii]ABJ76561.1 Membrane associated acid phosphatase [Leptospira borgpetersenii serovar Hardjo-bovis str. JB197]ABJ78523.1 Membrane associated acid phosphatase [Leptospira borgpetersenii serovar Hardjo-bovis str. L550]AMX57779.1 acid phosphatase [Leptospira borgpetersenii serovar Hardjo]AMX61012.1 acid phosphatase [Leptospira borgpetersenii serovar Hardjo]AMX64255.1 acid phosphatase [Leptospira borgpetersenii serovar Hardjo]
MSVEIGWFQDSFWFGERFLQTLHGSALDPVLGIVTLLFHYLGGSTFGMIFLSVVYVFVDRKLGIRLGAGFLIAGIINGMMKALFESPRPSLSWIGPGTLSETSYGFPSGHVQTSVVIWGLVLIHVKNKTIRVLSLFIILFMPFSRMYAGVHYPGDTLGGIILGLIVIVLIEIIFRVFPEFEFPTPYKGQTLSNTKTLALVVVVLTLSSVLLHSNLDSLAKIKSYEQVISASGALGGFTIGILFSKFYTLDWKKVDSVAETIQRAAVLISGILLFYILPGIIVQRLFPENPVARYLRYGIVSSYIAFFSAYILVKRKEKADKK